MCSVECLEKLEVGEARFIPRSLDFYSSGEWEMSGSHSTVSKKAVFDA